MSDSISTLKAKGLPAEALAFIESLPADQAEQLAASVLAALQTKDARVEKAMNNALNVVPAVLSPGEKNAVRLSLERRHMHIETRAELLKLSRLLESDEGSLDFLDGQNLDQLARVPQHVSGFFYAQHQDSHQRLAGISKLVPTGASAKLATTVLGSVLAAGIASEPLRNAPSSFPTNCPMTSRQALHSPGALPVPRSACRHARQDRGAGRADPAGHGGTHHPGPLRGSIKPSALQAITATVNDGEAMVKIALYLEDKSKPIPCSGCSAKRSNGPPCKRPPTSSCGQPYSH